MIAALVAAPLSVTAPAPAHAAVIGAGIGTAANCSGLHCYTAVLTADVQPLGGGDVVLVAWNCQATGTLDPASTAISVCSVGLDRAPALALPGPFAATAGATTAVVGTRLTACVGGSSTFVETVFGAQMVQDTECFPLVVTKIV